MESVRNSSRDERFKEKLLKKTVKEDKQIENRV